MIWLLIVTSSVCGSLAVHGAPTLYQAEENNDITIKWNNQTVANMSNANLRCVLQSEPVKILYEVMNGVEVSESQDQQFAGRVRCDGDALHLSRVSTRDSGSYRCDLTANYDEVTKTHSVKASELFILDVMQSSHGNHSDVSVNTSGQADTVGVRHPHVGPKQRHGRSYILTVVAQALAAAALVALIIYGLYLATPALKPIAAIIHRHLHHEDTHHHHHEHHHINSKLLQV